VTLPKIDIEAIDWKGGTGYPEPFRDLVMNRKRKRLGDAGGLTQFGVNLTRLPPGSGSAHRHWHANEDEFVFILDGEVTLIEDDGETLLRAGEAAAFKAGVANGHHLVNRGGRDVTYLEIGTRAATDRGTFPDIDLAFVKDAEGARWTRKNENGQAVQEERP
jgi:uncharacterized cupin superfamily protein